MAGNASVFFDDAVLDDATTPIPTPGANAAFIVDDVVLDDTAAPVAPSVSTAGTTLGMPPRDALLVRFLPPSGQGVPVVVECPDDLEISHTAPGGHDAITCTIPWEPGVPAPAALGVEAVAQVIDRRNGGIVWHGRVIDPGPTVSSAATSYQVSARGAQAVLDDSRAPLAYVDRSTGRWVPAKQFANGGLDANEQARLAAHPQDWIPDPRVPLEQTINEGAKLDASTPSNDSALYVAPKYSDASNLDIVGALVSVQASAALQAAAGVYLVAPNGTTQTAVTWPWSSILTQTDVVLRRGVGTWTQPTTEVLQLKWGFSNATDATTGRDYWLRWSVAVAFRRLNIDGTDSGATGTAVTVAEIVYDLAGRMLRDRLEVSAGALVPPLGDRVEQAAWWEGASVREVFEFLADVAPQHYVAVWGPGGTGLPRLTYQGWRGHPRYVLPPDVRVELAGGGDDLANAALVSYQVTGEVTGTVKVTGSVPQLAAAGTSRAITVDITGRGPVSESTARAAGEEALAAANLATTSGTVTVAAPVLDLATGRQVEPWEILPGHAVHLSSAAQAAPSGYPVARLGDRDGTRTFWCTEVRYSAGTNTATLTLDGGARSLFNRVRTRAPERRRKKAEARRR